LFSKRVLCTRFQPQRLKHWRAFAFSAYGRKFKPPALRVVVDSGFTKNHYHKEEQTQDPFDHYILR
jgi:hypothetical protein